MAMGGLGGLSAMGGLKRAAANQFDDVPQKSSKVEGENWTCPKCGNSNFAGRQFCNMRNCGAPKPGEEWTCPACGNENRAGRMSCNMRKCQMLKPGLTLKDLQRAPVVAQGGVSALAQFPVGTPGGLAGAVPRERQEGAWVCRACGNQNFPGRLTCNRRSCGLPIEQASGGMVKQTAPASVNPMVAAQMLMAQQMMAQMGGGVQSAPAAAAPVPDQSWICIACNNVNYPTRMECNGRNCKRPRAEVDGGPVTAGINGNRPASAKPKPDMAAEQEKLIGAWTCPSCANVNYATRMSCNRRTCGQPRPAGV